MSRRGSGGLLAGAGGGISSSMTRGSDPAASSTARTSGARGFANALTVDVEDYFHVEAFRKVVGVGEWEQYPLRVEESTRRLLDLFDRHGVKGTFFVLGWVARKRPRVVEEIARRGHELGCHSYWHRLVYGLEPDEFRADTREATAAIEDAAGRTPRLYRAPSFSVAARSLWALDVLAELGYELDSSIFPIRHDLYGFPEFPSFPVRVLLGSGRSITEFPMSTTRFLGRNFPGPGGGWLRILPGWYSRLVLGRIHRREAAPGMVYLHPWEVDPAQPRIRASWRSRFRHYTCLESTERKLEALLERFRFAPLGEVLALHPPRREVAVSELAAADRCQGRGKVPS
jgi:polysaccharide deacetylase family protein (PEP-CTERM system associated)